MKKSIFDRPFIATPRTIEDTFKTKKRIPSKLISETLQADGSILKVYAPSPELKSLKFNRGNLKCQNDMKFNFWNLRSAW